MPVWKSGSTTLQKLFNKLGARGPHEGSSYAMRGNTPAARACYLAPSMRNGTFLLDAADHHQFVKVRMRLRFSCSVALRLVRSPREQRGLTIGVPVPTF